jgi:nitrate reductase assembly molybdenum cofactor insertion protein NarJ
VNGLTLLAEADLLLLLARCLTDPGARDLAELAEPECGWDAVLAPLPAEEAEWISPALRVLHAHAQAAGLARLRLEHTRLFQGAIACPLDETAWIRRDKGHILADIAGFYRAFGLVPKASGGEKPDHLPTELEFLALLMVVQARALKEGRAEEAEVTAAAVRSFAADHTGEFIGSFCCALADTTSEAFYSAVAETLRRFWEGFCARRGIALPALAALAGEPADERSEFDCSGCGS